MIWYKRTWRFLSPLIHSWTARIPVSSLHFKVKSCTLLSRVLKVKFSGGSCSDIESISTILSAAWNKTNPSSQIFRILGDFLGLVGVLKVTDWTLSHYDCRYCVYLPRFTYKSIFILILDLHENKTRNATHCNNRDDFPHLSFIWKFQYFWRPIYMT